MKVHIIYASTSGHTEYVVEHLVSYLQKKAKRMRITTVRAEQANAADFGKGDVLIMASGTWNTGGIEGQLNPYMHELVHKKAKDIHLHGKPVAIIALGDTRYRYTSRAGEYLAQFVESHAGALMKHRLTVVNEPYGQEVHFEKWANHFIDELATLRS